MVEQLAGPFVEAEPHHARLGGLRVHVQYVCQVGQVFARDGANAPHFLQPGFEFAFFKTCRMDSFEILSIYSSETSVSLSKDNVQRAGGRFATRQAGDVRFQGRGHFQRLPAARAFYQRFGQSPGQVAALDAVVLCGGNAHLRLNGRGAAARAHQQERVGPRNGAASAGAFFDGGPQGGQVRKRQVKRGCEASYEQEDVRALA